MARTNRGRSETHIQHSFGKDRLFKDCSDDSSSVYVSIHADQPGHRPAVDGPAPNIPWTMYLERADSKGLNWKVIGTRTGYVHTTSPSNREFTNIGYHNTLVRVRVVYKSPYDGRTYVSPTPMWKR